MPNRVARCSAVICSSPAQGGVQRAAVVGDDRRARAHRVHQHVPHHPGSARRDEHPVAWADIVVQGVRLQALQQDAAVRVDQSLRRAGRPGAE